VQDRFVKARADYNESKTRFEQSVQQQQSEQQQSEK
jgi:hypothetical protein